MEVNKPSPKEGQNYQNSINKRPAQSKIGDFFPKRGASSIEAEDRKRMEYIHKFVEEIFPIVRERAESRETRPVWL